MSFGGDGGVPKLGRRERPSKAPNAPKRTDKNIRKPAQKKAAQMARTGSTVSNLLSARADGVVGAAAPTTSYTSNVLRSF